METRKRIAFLALSAVLLAAIVYSADRLAGRGVLSWHVRQAEYRKMAAELSLCFLISLAVFLRARSAAVAAACLGAVLAVFTWGHMVFLPLAVSGLYAGYVLLTGYSIRTWLMGRKSEEEALAFDMTLGVAILILGYCAMSAAGVGDILSVQKAVLISGLFLSAVNGRRWLRTGAFFRARSAVFAQKRCGLGTALSLSVLFVALTMQLGRLNIAIDFDSLWYGLRTPYILNNGQGVYENMGTVGVVYTYSKGFEVLTLPLSNLPSYSFVTCFNVWMTAAALFAGYRIALRYMSRRYAIYCAALLSAIPGIMNMSLTAKSDTMTLLMQLCLILFLLRFLDRRDNTYLCMGVSAFLVSWTLKPTALVFSSAVLGMGALCLAVRGICDKSVPGRVKIARRIFPQTLGVWLGAGALAAIWARTLIIVGVPVTSVFSSALVRLGFRMKYPFNVSGVPNAGAGMKGGELIAHLAKRLWGFLLNPSGEDMSHVILAWGGFPLFFLFLIWLFRSLGGWGRAGNEKSKTDRGESLECVCGMAVLLPFLAVNLVSLWMLSQVDGNYFMLLYAMGAVAVCRLLYRVYDARWRKRLTSLMVLVIAFQLAVMSLTNWAWTARFSKLSFRHHGYFNHMDAAFERMSLSGNAKIWEILKSDPRKRLIAVGSHPDALAFPCSAQSYDDITGVWGNVVLVKTMDNFIEFMEYAKTDYVYMQAGYMGEGERRYELMRYLIENGTLTDIVYEEGNALARVDLDGVPCAQATEALTEFDGKYRRMD